MEKLLKKHHFCNLQVSPKKLYRGAPMILGIVPNKPILIFSAR
jgi:hypothetical protein